MPVDDELDLAIAEATGKRGLSWSRLEGVIQGPLAHCRLRTNDTGRLVARRREPHGTELVRMFARCADAEHQWQEIRSSREGEPERVFTAQELATELVLWTAS